MESMPLLDDSFLCLVDKNKQQIIVKTNTKNNNNNNNKHLNPSP